MKKLGAWLLLAVSWLVLMPASPATAQSCYGYRINFSWSYAQSPYVDQLIWRDGICWGRRTVSCSQGYVSVWVDAYGIFIGNQYVAHDETAYGNAELNCTIGFPSPGPYATRPDGVEVRGTVTASAGYEMAGGLNPSFICSVGPQAHTITASTIPTPAVITSGAASGVFPTINCTDPTPIRKPGYTLFDVARISTTAHAHPLGGTGYGHDCTVTSKGNARATSWGIMPGYMPYWLP